ncbi:Hypp4436 [Branchiostoma lanceolatum]|uniref:Hypp4436 protein n=1 Tax=Branchiostoma lanceolatum TaxID=7740 RepID=A0A8K0EYJ4_BRALA|nr:Hypp4436 [Branchiostoma lanceolatum]
MVRQARQTATPEARVTALLGISSHAAAAAVRVEPTLCTGQADPRRTPFCGHTGTDTVGPRATTYASRAEQSLGATEPKMKLVLSLVLLCLAGAACARTVQDLESELLQAIREMVEDPQQGEDSNIIDTMPPYSEEEKEEETPGEDNTIESMSPYSEGEEDTPDEYDTIDPTYPDPAEEGEYVPGEDTELEPTPSYLDGEEYDSAEYPSLTDEDAATEEQGEGDQQAETLQVGREVKTNKVQDVTMKVTYKGEESEERVSFDDVTGSETIQVSARSDMEEANIRHCFDEGLSLECFPGSSKCYLLSIASQGEPGLQQQKEDMAKLLEESPSGEVSADGAPEVTINWVEKEKVSREDLPACLADFQPESAVFSAVKAPEDEGTVTDDQADAGATQEGKRYLSGGSQQCTHGACPIKKRVQKQGNCYYIGCWRNRRLVCNTFSTECVCCPEVTRASQCLVCRH